MNAKHVLALACAACVAAGLAQGAVAAQSPGSDRFHPANAEQARASGIQMMARSFGISPAAAASRMNVEEHAPDIVERIRTQYANRLAGIYIEHAPTHRLVVRLTGLDFAAAPACQGDRRFRRRTWEGLPTRAHSFARTRVLGQISRVASQTAVTQES